MPQLVMKFGGTSVAGVERIKSAAGRIKHEVDNGYDVIAVVSAMSGRTNMLSQEVESISPLFDAREYDVVVSSGEIQTAGLMALALQEIGVPARSWQGWQVPITTNSAYGAAHVIDIGTTLLNAKFTAGMRAAVVAGFPGSLTGESGVDPGPGRLGYVCRRDRRCLWC